MALRMWRVARLGNLRWGICLRIKLKSPVFGWLRKSYHRVSFLLKTGEELSLEPEGGIDP